MKKYGLCGHPVMHSLSPKLFEAAYPLNVFCYELITIEDPAKVAPLFFERGYSGLNITAPLKTSVLPFVHRLTPECASIGASNLILKLDDLLIAYNTDYIGVANSLKEAKVSIKNSVCLLLGAGGAAKAAAYTLLQEGATLLWANRTFATIPHSFYGTSIHSIHLHEAVHHLHTCNIVVNTLPKSVPDTECFNFQIHQTVCDASYLTRPLERQAVQAGAKYINGKRWLLHQAAPSFAAMTGAAPNIHLMESCSSNEGACIQINPYLSRKFSNRL